MIEPIYIAGAGYVGLASAACYASKGIAVLLYEKNVARRKAIEGGRIPLYEPDLERLFFDARRSGRISIVTNPVDAVKASSICFVTVGTPPRKDGSNDVSSVLDACQDIGRGLRSSSKNATLVIRSTVFPGTTNHFVRQTVEKASLKKAGKDFGLVCYPEFLREGSAIYDLKNPSRIVLGEYDETSGDSVEAFLRDFHEPQIPRILKVTCTEAEMIKYASNAFLGTKIAFMNEIANLCEHFEDVDVGRVADGVGLDSRIGRAFLDAGIGFGGSCLPKDMKALVVGAKQMQERLRLCEAGLISNEHQALRVVAAARRLLGKLRGKHAAILGLSFKPRTDDIREAPSLRVISAVLRAGMHVAVYDPAGMENTRLVYGSKLRYATGISDCLEGADCCFILTEWDEFKNVDTSMFFHKMRSPVVIDGRRVLVHSQMDHRIQYRAVGLGKRLSS